MPTDDEMREVALNQVADHAAQLEEKAKQHEAQGREEMSKMFRDAVYELRCLKRLYEREL